MSSLAHDDDDNKLFALPWVSDPRRQDETRRLQEQVVEAARPNSSASLASWNPKYPRNVLNGKTDQLSNWWRRTGMRRTARRN